MAFALDINLSVPTDKVFRVFTCPKLVRELYLSPVLACLFLFSRTDRAKLLAHFWAHPHSPTQATNPPLQGSDLANKVRQRTIDNAQDQTVSIHNTSPECITPN